MPSQSENQAVREVLKLLQVYYRKHLKHDSSSSCQARLSAIERLLENKDEPLMAEFELIWFNLRQENDTADAATKLLGVIKDRLKDRLAIKRPPPYSGLI